MTDMDLDEERWIWITVGSDKIIKVCVVGSHCSVVDLAVSSNLFDDCVW